MTNVSTITITVPTDKIKRLAELTRQTVDQTIHELQNELINELIENLESLHDLHDTIESSREEIQRHI
jgi:ferritin